MNSHHARRSGRQIPEWIIISVVLSLSMICGLPLRLFLLRDFPRMNPFIAFLLPIGIGFLILLALWLLIAATTWLLVRTWQILSRKK